MAGDFDIQAFTRDEQAVARLVHAADVFGFLTRSLRVPPGCAALVWPESGPPTVAAAGCDVSSDGAARLLLARTTPVSLEYELAGLRSSDGYDVFARVRLAVQIVPDRAELTSFAQAVLRSGRAVTRDALRQHCYEAVSAAAARFVEKRTATELVNAASWPQFDEVLAEAFKPVGFACGLTLGRDPWIEIHSPAFDEARREQRSDALREKRREEEKRLRAMAARARDEHLNELAASLDKLRELSEKNTGISQIDLIRSFSPDQRGGLYHALVARPQTAGRTESIAVVAGEEVLWFDPRGPAQPSRRSSLSSEVGPLRSVRVAPASNGSTVLLIGARRGVHLLETEQDPRRTYAFDAPRDLRGGVNASAIVQQHLFASHSEVGLVRWPLRTASQFEFVRGDLFEGARTVRDVQADDGGAVWVASDQRVMRLGPASSGKTEETILNAPAVVTMLLLAERYVYAGCETGQVVRWPLNDLGVRQTVRAADGAPVESLAWLEGGGVPRMLVGLKRPYLELLVLGDSYSARYAADQPIRWGLAGPDVIVGVNDRRDQLLIWRIDAPETPESVVSVARLCGHSIQDAALVPSAPPGAVA